MHDVQGLSIRGPSVDGPTHEFYHHSSGQRVATDAVLVEAIRREYPKMHLTVVPSGQGVAPCDLLSYANATGEARFTPIIDSKDPLTIPMSWRSYRPPARRADAGSGVFGESVKFGKYHYSWKTIDFILYIATARDGTAYYPNFDLQYLVGPRENEVNDLIKTVTTYSMELHDEIWVFDHGYWSKNKELYQSVIKARWDDVILDADMKKALQNDAIRFFDSRERYRSLRVPYKRGVIYFGPPGNGKTISIKAMMHTLYTRADPIPTLYVRTLTSFPDPSRSVQVVFDMARRMAPCMLVLEDLDSLVNDSIRSYFLNEVDGLQTNDGVLIVGSTNYLERLDPGISKRPSRFDRKFYFPKPSLAERVQYCNYWRGKLADEKDIEWPEGLSEEIAGITDDFSFAFLQEAFTAALLAIAAHDEDEGKSIVHVSKDKFAHIVLWIEIKKQIELLREEI